jgi:hypothetical protein
MTVTHWPVPRIIDLMEAIDDLLESDSVLFVFYNMSLDLAVCSLFWFCFQCKIRSGSDHSTPTRSEGRLAAASSAYWSLLSRLLDQRCMAMRILMA